MTETAASAAPRESRFHDRLRAELSRLQLDYPQLSGVNEALAAWTLSSYHGLDIEDGVDAVLAVPDPDSATLSHAVVFDSDESAVTVLRASANGEIEPDDQLEQLFLGIDTLRSPQFADMAGERVALLGARLRDALAGGARLVAELVDLSVTEGPTAARLREVAASRSIDQLEYVTLGNLYEHSVRQATRNDLSEEDEPVVWTLLAPMTEFAGSSPGSTPKLLLGIVDAASVGASARKYGARIVSRNVRYRLRSSRVNRAIAETLGDPEKVERLALLNNGLTVTCDSFELANGTVAMWNPQIVNGAQTTFTISKSSISDGVAGLVVRLIEVPPGKVGDALALEIAEATNRQNAVTGADLKSNDPRQEAIELEFRKLEPPWFYERKRNWRQSLGDAELERFGTRIITKEDVAQRWRAFIGEPAAAIRSKASNFDRPDVYGEIFAPHVDVSQYLLAHELFRYFYGLLSADRGPERLSLHSAFDDRARDLVAHARSQWAAHCTALARDALERLGSTLDPGECAEIVDDLANLTGRTLRVARLVVASTIKWVENRRVQAQRDDEPLDIKRAFEDPSSLEEMRVELAFLFDFAQ